MSSVTEEDPGPQDEPVHTPSGLGEFIRGPWFPLVCVLVVILVIVVVLVLTGSITGLPAVLTALAAVITAVGGLIAATRFRS
ncbi:hypothetical protein [Dactylosporangium sp. NPDC006015]|uniref:hypothetical protein n=1 Tax=Dactylosporangium sp. NPDC006015 TaxID=3154576 RepID=UPI0033B51EEC